jgi:hypothetical protein
MTIGAGWAEGAWVDASWVVGAWAQPTATKTIGGTSQLGAITSTGGITVQNIETIGGTAQIDALSSTGGLNLGWQIGGTSQLAAFTSSGFIQVGDVIESTGGQRGPITVGKKKRKTLKTQYTKEEEYYLSKEFVEKVEQGIVEVAGVEVVLPEPIAVPQPPEQLVELSGIKDEIEREIAQLMREKEVEEYKVKVKEYVDEMKQMEMKMYFIALALLDEDF